MYVSPETEILDMEIEDNQNIVGTIAIHTTIAFIIVFGFDGDEAISQALHVQIIGDAQYLRHIAERGEIHRTFPVVGGHEVKQHDSTLIEIIVFDFPCDFIDNAVLHALGHDAVADTSFLVDGEFHVTARYIIIGVVPITFHRFGVVKEVDDLLQLNLLALEVFFLFNRTFSLIPLSYSFEVNVSGSFSDSYTLRPIWWTYQ